jgi:trigger factor
MRSSIDKLEGLGRKLKVEIPAETVQQAFDKVYKNIQKDVTIKGFRKGKAPLNTIRSIYADKVRSEVVNDLVNESYSNALSEHSIEPVGFPKIAFNQIEEDKVFEFTAEFEVRPEVQVNNYENLAVQKEKLEVGDDRINAILENIRNSQSETVAIFEDRAVAMGDVAVVDFDGIVNGAPLQGGSAQGHELELGSKQFIDGFEEALVGMKIGDSREINLRFPEGYHEASLSGAPVTFKTKLVGIKKKQLPELNDEFAQKVGKFTDLNALKADIRRDLAETEEKRINDDLKNRIVKALVEKNPVEAPRGLVEEQKSALIEDFKQRMSQQGMPEAEFSQYKEKWAADFEKTSEFMVRSTFLLDTLADKLSLRATKEDIENKIDSYAKQTGLELAKIKEFYGKPERKQRLAFQVTEEKVVNFLISKAKITEVDKEKLAKENA